MRIVSGLFVVAILCPLILPLCRVFGADDTAEVVRKVEKDLPVLGHRNWIVIADSAYPWQSRAGIETIATNADQLTTVKSVLEILDKAKHVHPKINLDAELPLVPEADAPGIKAYRDELAKLLDKHTITTLPHEEIISKLDKAAETFKILLIKTNMTLPYTSVFMELECGYWNADAEKRLRDAMKK